MGMALMKRRGEQVLSISSEDPEATDIVLILSGLSWVAGGKTDVHRERALSKSRVGSADHPQSFRRGSTAHLDLPPSLCRLSGQERAVLAHFTFCHSHAGIDDCSVDDLTRA